MSAPNIFGESRQDDILRAVGTALLQVKNGRDLTLGDMAYQMGRGDDMVAKYIAGESEMGLIAWNRAVRAWPELIERLEESAAEREARRRQRALDLEQPTRRSQAA
jgi:alkylated DNA nucleotide flippase Atl1